MNRFVRAGEATRPRQQKLSVVGEARRGKSFLETAQASYDVTFRSRRLPTQPSPLPRAGARRAASGGREDPSAGDSKRATSPHNIYLKYREPREVPRCRTASDLPAKPASRQRSGDDCFLFRELCNLRTLSNSFLASVSNDVFLLRNTLDNEKQFLNSLFAQLSEKLRALRGRAVEQLDTAFRATLDFLQGSVQSIRLHRDSVDRLISNFDTLEDASSSLSLLLDELRLRNEQLALPRFDDVRRRALFAEVDGLLEQCFATPTVHTSFAAFDVFNGEISSFKRRFSSVLKTSQGPVEGEAPPVEAALATSVELVSLRRLQAAVNQNEESLKKLIERSAERGLRELRSQESAEEETGTQHSSVLDSPPLDAAGRREPRFESPAAKPATEWLKTLHLRKNSML